MAYYKIILDEKMYVNQQLCCVANKLGGPGLIREIGNGTFTQRQFFDDMLYSVKPDQNKAYKPFDSVVKEQNVDLTIQTLEHTLEMPRVVIPKATKPEVFTHGGFKFVRFHDVTDSGRYRLQGRMAILRVCGSIYVALNAKVSGEKAPVIVTIEA